MSNNQYSWTYRESLEKYRKKLKNKRRVLKKRLTENPDKLNKDELETKILQLNKQIKLIKG